MFLGASFSLVYMPTSPDASFIQKLQDGGRKPEVPGSYKFATANGKRYQGDLSGGGNVLGHVRSTSTGIDIVRLRRTASGTNRK